MPTILARDAEAGRRYRCVDAGEFSGDIVEIRARPSDLRGGRLVPLTTRDGSFIHVSVVVGNRKAKEADPSRPLVIPAFYKLEPYEGAYKKPPARRRVSSRPPRTGRKVDGHDASAMPAWRGWAYGARHDMERLLEVVQAEGFDLKEGWRFYRVAYKLKTCMAVFKAGQLGFPQKPVGPLGQLPAKKPTTDPYMPFQVELGAVMAADRWEEMLDMLRRYLREFKRSSDARR